MGDSRESALWIMNTDGTRNRFLAKGSIARWSPNGDRIVYTAPGEPKGSQVFVRWMDAEGATSQVTRVEQSPNGIGWSPDGTQIAFSMSVEDKVEWPIKMPKKPEGAKWTETPQIVERLNDRRDRQGFTDTGYRHIFVVPASGGTPRRLTDGNFDHGAAPEWTPDGKSISSAACVRTTQSIVGAKRRSMPSTSPAAPCVNSRAARVRTTIRSCRRTESASHTSATTGRKTRGSTARST